MQTTAAPPSDLTITHEAPEPRSRPGIGPKLLSWALLGAVFAYVLTGTLNYDFRSGFLIGDQAAYLLQTTSLAGDGDLTFDQGDFARWEEIGWSPTPAGAFFQRHDDGWAFAKPYGYSAFAAPFVKTLGVKRGVATANSVLLVVTAAFIGLMLRRRYSGPVVPLAIGSFVLASYVYMYAYVIHPDLFLAALTAATAYCVLRAVHDQHFGFALAGAALMAFAFAEKASLAALWVGVALVLVGMQKSWAKRVAVALVGVVAVAVFVLPYLWASNGKSWNPYGGDRYHARTAVPFDTAGSQKGWVSASGAENFSAAFIGERLTRDLPEAAKSTGYYVVGRHTGLLPFIPVALALLVLSVIRLARDRRRPLAWALLLGMGAYVASYVVLYPTNYFGGGQSLGNRYFLQIAPAVVALATTLALPRIQVLAASVAGALLGLAFLFPHHSDPARAYRLLGRTSPLQRTLPFEHNQTDAPYAFVCGEFNCDH